MTFTQLRPTLSGRIVQHQEYNVIGLMSGSSLDGLDIAFVRLTRDGETWSHEWLATDCVPYDDAWTQRLRGGTGLSGKDLAYLHADYGHYLGATVSRFLKRIGGDVKPDLITSHGHTLFHDPAQGMTCQIGDGAAIAAETGIPVISDLRAMDIAYGGQGAPIVPMGERLLFPGYDYYLNLGGIANITAGADWQAYDVCACNQVLNYLAGRAGLAFDAGGLLASAGAVRKPLLESLNAVAYHAAPVPKSLDNSFSQRAIIPLIPSDMRDSDSLRTVVEHVAMQVAAQLATNGTMQRMLITGGGALNDFLISRIRRLALMKNVEVIVPDRQTIEFKEALVMALLGALRLEGKATVFSSVTGARADSCGGALWMPLAR